MCVYVPVNVYARALCEAIEFAGKRTILWVINDSIFCRNGISNTHIRRTDGYIYFVLFCFRVSFK